MINITAKLKERFCKDCNIPLQIYEEPYFTDRLELYDLFYQSIHKWNVFKSELKKYHCEQDYFEEYNCIKDQAINDIKNTVRSVVSKYFFRKTQRNPMIIPLVMNKIS